MWQFQPLQPSAHSEGCRPVSSAVRVFILRKEDLIVKHGIGRKVLIILLVLVCLGGALWGAGALMSRGITVQQLNVSELDAGLREQADAQYDAFASEYSAFGVYWDGDCILTEGFGKTVVTLPLLLADVQDVGTAGTGSWRFRPVLLTFDGASGQSLSVRWKVGSLDLTADPNTWIGDPSAEGNTLSITLTDGQNDKYVGVHASTRSSGNAPNAETTVEAAWEGTFVVDAFPLFLRKIPVSASVTIPYRSNVT